MQSVVAGADPSNMVNALLRRTFLPSHLENSYGHFGVVVTARESHRGVPHVFVRAQHGEQERGPTLPAIHREAHCRTWRCRGPTNLAGRTVLIWDWDCEVGQIECSSAGEAPFQFLRPESCCPFLEVQIQLRLVAADGRTRGSYMRCRSTGHVRSPTAATGVAAVGALARCDSPDCAS